MLIKDFFSEQLTTGQIKAIQLLQSFFSGDRNCFLLKGYAGTGKTFLLRGLIKYLENLGLPFKVMASTGRAAFNVKEKINIDANTIHKSIYDFNDLAEVDIDDKAKTFKYKFGLKQNDDSIGTVYIVDEASMISDIYSENDTFIFGSGRLLTDLLSYINFSQVRNKTKLIFIGDNAQLPPVTDKISPALNSEYLIKKFGISVLETELKDVVRQNDSSGILKNATEIRERIVTGLFNEFSIKEELADIKKLDRLTFFSTYLEVCDNKVSDETILITYSNENALKYNFEARKHFFPNTKEITIDDKVLIYQNNYNYHVPLMNGQFGKILQISHQIENKVIRFYIKGGKTPISKSYRFRDIILEVRDEKNTPQKIECKIVEDFLYSKYPQLSNEEQAGLYADFKQRNPHLKKGSDEFKNTLKADKYFNALRLKFGYAITCHKAQGGEWRNVFVDFDCPIGKNTESFYRWAYTAITRAKEKLFLFNTPFFTPITSLKLSEHFIGEEIIVDGDNHFYTANEISGDISFPDDKPFLKVFFDLLTKKIESLNIKVVQVVHFNYLEKYFLQKDNETVILNFYYNKRGCFTRATIQEATSGVLLKEIKEIILKVVQVYG